MNHNTPDYGGYGEPPPYGAMMQPYEDTPSGLAKASLITGIIAMASTICCCIPLVNYIAMPVAILCAKASLILGGIVLGTESAERLKSRKWATIGMCLGGGALLVGLVAFVLAFFVLGTLSALAPHQSGGGY